MHGHVRVIHLHLQKSGQIITLSGILSVRDHSHGSSSRNTEASNLPGATRNDAPYTHCRNHAQSQIS